MRMDGIRVRSALGLGYRNDKVSGADPAPSC
jgi:hypothetical protein